MTDDERAEWSFLFERVGAVKAKLRELLCAGLIQTPEDLASASEYAGLILFEFVEVHGERMRAVDLELFRSFLAAYELKCHLERRAAKRLYALDLPHSAPNWGPIEQQTVGALRARIDRLKTAMLGAERIHMELGDSPARRDVVGFCTAIEKIDQSYFPIRNVQLALEELRELRERWLDLRFNAEQLLVRDQKAPHAHAE
jgi:hypothetical protein